MDPAVLCHALFHVVDPMHTDIIKILNGARPHNIFSFGTEIGLPPRDGETDITRMMHQTIRTEHLPMGVDDIVIVVIA